MKLQYIFLTTLTAVSLSGCFFADQIHSKVYEDCYASPDYIRAQPADEQQRLAKKCGWKTQADTQMIARLCAAPILSQPITRIQNGIVNEKIDNSLTLQYKVENGKVSDELNIYYPNGNLETHMKFSNGLANDWSQGYTSSGVKRTEFLYKQGRAVKYKTYNTDGSLNTEGNIDCR